MHLLIQENLELSACINMHDLFVHALIALNLNICKQIYVININCHRIHTSLNKTFNMVQVKGYQDTAL